MEDIRQYAEIGLTHHLLYPACMSDEEYHVRTLEEMCGRDDIETIDCCIPFNPEMRSRALSAVKNCGKSVVYAMALFPLRKISLGSISLQEQAISRLVIKDQVEVAAQSGAVGFITGSGADVPEAERPAARRAFADFCRWFCAELKPHGITMMLEPFDRSIDKKYLFGPTEECVELIESLKPEVDNLALEIDMAHIPLMGETFEHAFRTAAPYIARVHLGNCVLKDPASPWYGDMHPPIGLEGGEVDVPELTEVLRILLDIGYLSKEKRGSLVFEIQPFPGMTPDETVRDNMDRLFTAWNRLTSV